MKNRELHELFGKQWHYLVKNKSKCRMLYGSFYGRYVCSCGFEDFKYSDFKNHLNKYNPDYAADPRLVIRGMEENGEFENFIMWLNLKTYYCTPSSDVLFELARLIAIDDSGKLRDLAISFLRGGKKE